MTGCFDKAAEVAPDPLDAGIPAEDGESGAEDQEESVAEEAGAGGEAQADPYLNLSIEADPTGLDPALATDNPGGILGFVTEGLTKVDKDFNVVPGIAQSYEANEDATRFTFHIKEGVLFHDGSPCDAEAVVWNYSRQIGEDGDSMPHAQDIFGNVTSVEAVDPLTVIVTLAEPDSSLPVRLAMAEGAGLSSPAAWEADPEEFQRHPVGAGPYLFREWERGESIALEANPAYHGGEVRNPGVRFRIIKEPAVRTADYLAGKLDFIDGINLGDVDRIEASGFRVDSHPSLGHVFYGFANYQDHPVFRDQRVRRAVWHALDRKAIVDALYNGRIRVAASMLPPGTTGSGANFTTYEYDPDRAVELLEEAGYPSGFAFTLVSRSEAQHQALAALVQEQLAEVGITMDIALGDRAAWLEEVFNGEPEHGMIQVNWATAVNDPYGMASLWLGSNSGGYNVSGYQNPAFDTAVEEGRRTGDPTEQARLYGEAAQVVNDDAPGVFFHTVPTFSSTAPSLEDAGGLLGSYASCPFWEISKSA